MAKITQRAKERLEQLKAWLAELDRQDAERNEAEWRERLVQTIGRYIESLLAEDVRRVAAEIAAGLAREVGREEALASIEAAVADLSWNLALGPEEERK